MIHVIVSIMALHELKDPIKESHGFWILNCRHTEFFRMIEHSMKGYIRTRVESPRRESRIAIIQERRKGIEAALATDLSAEQFIHTVPVSTETHQDPETGIELETLVKPEHQNHFVTAGDQR